MSYVIHPNEWEYDNTYSTLAHYVDSDMGFKITLANVRDRYNYITGVKMLGESTGVLDSDNSYYYDLSQNRFSNGAFANVYKSVDDILGYDDTIETDVEIPQWFVDHMMKLTGCEMYCLTMFDNVERNDMSPAELSNAIYNYVDSDNIEWYHKITDGYLINDVLYVAEKHGRIVL